MKYRWLANTPHLRQMERVRSCPMDRWRNIEWNEVLFDSFLERGNTHYKGKMQFVIFVTCKFFSVCRSDTTWLSECRPSDSDGVYWTCVVLLFATVCIVIFTEVRILFALPREIFSEQQGTFYHPKLKVFLRSARKPIGKTACFIHLFCSANFYNVLFFLTRKRTVHICFSSNRASNFIQRNQWTECDPCGSCKTH